MENIPAEARAIIHIIENISIDYCGSSWLSEIEHEIWEELIKADPKLLDTILQKLAASCRGWVRYNNESKDWEGSRVFVPIDEWIAIHAAVTGTEMTKDQRKRFELFMNEPERKRQELEAQSEKLLDCGARVALAIQASGREEVHNDFLEILKMIPEEIRKAKTQT